jgi:hypothetical protein
MCSLSRSDGALGTWKPPEQQLVVEVERMMKLQDVL